MENVDQDAQEEKLPEEIEPDQFIVELAKNYNALGELPNQIRESAIYTLLSCVVIYFGHHYASQNPPVLDSNNPEHAIVYPMAAFFLLLPFYYTWMTAKLSVSYQENYKRLSTRSISAAKSSAKMPTVPEPLLTDSGKKVQARIQESVFQILDPETHPVERPIFQEL